MIKKIGFISIMLIVLLFGFAFGYAFKESQMKDIEKVILQKYCKINCYTKNVSLLSNKKEPKDNFRLLYMRASYL